MEVRRFGKPLLKLRSLPVLTFLAPSIVPVRRPRTMTSRAALLDIGSPQHARCLFTPTACRKAGTGSDGSDMGRPAAPKASSATQRIDSLLDDLLPPRPPGVSSSRESSASDTRNAYTDWTSNRRDSNLRDSAAPQRGDYSKGMDFPGPPSSSSSLNNASSSVSIGLEEAREIRPRAKRTVLSRATVGRTIEVDTSRGVDFGRALRSLGILLATNKVNQDLQRQRFHERPGLKRKRLKSERWRKLFKEGFRATVTRVQEMRRKGW